VSEKSPRRFFLPGPAHVEAEILESLTAPITSHRAPSFSALYASLAPRLQRVFRTEQDVLIATGSSTLVMESSLVSAPGEAVLHLTNGAFSERFEAINRSRGREPDRLAAPWGEAIDPDLVRAALGRKRYDAVTVVHNETSTGVMNPLAEIARAVREESDALLLVDTVSSLAGAPVETDVWPADVVLAGVQKALALPPGLTLFTISDRYAERAARLAHRGFYTDLLRYRDKHRQGGTITTPAIPQMHALGRQLDVVLGEGLEARWERHRSMGERTREWAVAAGFELAAAPGAYSWTLTCLRPPAGVEAPALVRELAARGWVVGGGYGRWKPSTFRIGHMGQIQLDDLEALFGVIEEVVELLRERSLAADPAR
jgi:aspartate aminotransferase-like enzyme